MKNLILLISLVFSSMAFANSSDSASVYFTGNDTGIEQLQLRTEATRVEYYDERVPSTCYRTEHRRSCRRVPGQCRQVCRNNRCRTVCGQPRMQCRRIPITVPYPCTRTVTRSRRVHDYNVDINVTIDYAQAYGSNFSEKITVEAKGDSYSLSANGSGNHIILLKNVESNSRRQGRNLKVIDLNYTVGFADASEVNSVTRVGPRNASYRNGSFEFITGKAFASSSFINNLKVYKDRRVLGDKKLFDRNITSADYTTEQRGNDILVRINLGSLGVKIPKRVKFVLSSEYIMPSGKVLNAQQVSRKFQKKFKFN